MLTLDPTSCAVGIIISKGKFSSLRGFPKFRMDSTDEELIDRVVQAFGVPKYKHKDGWVTVLTGQRALEFGWTVYPYMTSKVKQQIMGMRLAAAAGS